MIFSLTGRVPGNVPATYRKYLLAGTRPYFIDGSEGGALLQEIKGMDYRLRYDIFFGGSGIDMPFQDTATSVTMVYVVEGTMTLSGKDIRLEENSYYLCSVVPAAQAASVHGGTCRLMQIDVTQALATHSADYGLLDKLYQRMDNEAPGTISCIVRGDMDYRMLKVIDTLLKGTGTPWEMELLAQATASALVKLFVGGLESSSAGVQLSQRDIRKLQAVREYISGNLDMQLRMSQLAKIYGGSADKLNKQYKMHFGENIRHYMHRLKMELAQTLLHDRKVTVNEVAEMTGYNNANNFTRAFTGYFGRTPSSAKGGHKGEGSIENDRT